MFLEAHISSISEYFKPLVEPVPIVQLDKPLVKIKPKPKPPAQAFIPYKDTAWASWYGDREHGNHTASGEIFNMYGLTAAHNSLRFGTKVRVTNLSKGTNRGKSVIVRINDTGGFTPLGREIDLSYGAARAIGGIEAGVFPVKLEIVKS